MIRSVWCGVFFISPSSCLVGIKFVLFQFHIGSCRAFAAFCFQWDVQWLRKAGTLRPLDLNHLRVLDDDFDRAILQAGQRAQNPAHDLCFRSGSKIPRFGFGRLFDEINFLRQRILPTYPYQFSSCSSHFSKSFAHSL